MTLKQLADLPSPTMDERREAVRQDVMDRAWAAIGREVESGKIRNRHDLQCRIGFDCTAAVMRQDKRYTTLLALVSMGG